MSGSREHHLRYPVEALAATLEAHGAVVGTMTARGVLPPKLTPELRAAYDAAFSVMFDRGFEAAMRSVARRVRAELRGGE